MDIKAKKAAALKYTPGVDSVPVISAVGKGIIADKIIETAQENDVPVIEDTTAADVLSNFSAGDAIPEQLYEVIAQILVFIAQTDEKLKNKLPK